MGTQPSIFDPHGLKEAEETYRFVLRREPDNMDTRIDLAWCLLLQAVYLSGQETVIAEQSDLREDVHDPCPQPKRLPGPDARDLLQECLRHSLTVRHLSPRASNQLDMKKLEALVLLAGGKELLVSNEEGGARIKDQIVRAIQQASHHDDADNC